MAQDYKELLETVQLLLIQVKNGEIEIFPKEDNTPDYLQKLESLISKIETNSKKNKIDIRTQLSERAAFALAMFLTEKHELNAISYSWALSEIKSVKLEQFPNYRNFGIKSKKEIQEFINHAMNLTN